MKNFNYNVEIVVLLLRISITLVDPILTNLITYRTCYILFEHDQTECLLLGKEENNVTLVLEKLVEPKATTIKMVFITTKQILAAIFCVFLGQWSDRFGRKPIIMFCLIGEAIFMVFLTIYSYFPNLSPWYIITCSIPVMLTGGFRILSSSVLSYITDITGESDRGVRMAIFEGMILTGEIIGSFCSTYIFNAFGYSNLFSIATIINFINLGFMLFFVPESLHVTESQGKFKNLFGMFNISQAIKTTFQYRNSFKRSIILLCFIIISVEVFIFVGSESLFFFYVRAKFQWTLKHFTVYNSIIDIIVVFTSVSTIYILNKKLQIRESVLISMGICCLLIASLLRGLARNDFHIYLAAVVKSVAGITNPMAMALLSKMVNVQEVGKVFSILEGFIIIFSLSSAPIYTAIYNSTIKEHSEIFNFVTAGICLLNLGFAACIHFLEIRSCNKEYVRLIDEK